MNSKKYLIIAAVILFGLLNFTPVKYLLGGQDCHYSNYTGSFTFEQINSKERNFDHCLYNFGEFKKRYPADTILYRTCAKSWWKIWQYGDYLFHPQWKLPYLSWAEIDKRRGPLQNKSGFQDF